MNAGRSTDLDHIDRTILRALRSNARASVRAIAERAALSTSATSERIRRLEQRGVIVGYRAELSDSALGRPYEAIIGIRTRADADRDALEDWLVARPSVVEVVHVTGPHDYLVRARCHDAAELDALLMTMKADAGVAETETRVVLRSLPIDPERW